MSADFRALAAVRFVDLASGAQVTDALRLESDGEWIQNLGGDWVLRRHPALPGYHTSFALPAGLPPVGSVAVRVVVRDPKGRWLPRAFRISLPRAADDLEHPLFARIPVALCPGPAAPARQSWGVVRVHVRFHPVPGAPEGVPIEGALVRVSTSGGDLRGHTLTDRRGEASVPVPRIPLFAPGEGDGPVLSPDVLHHLDVVLDPGATDFGTGARATVADPDQLWDDRDSLRRISQSALLSVGRELSRVIDVAP